MSIGDQSKAMTKRHGSELVMWTMLIALTVWFYIDYRAAWNLWDRSKNDFAVSEKLAVQIQGLQESPQFAALEAESASEFAQIIERATTGDLISPESLIRIEPQSAVRLGKSSYTELPTRLELRNVSLSEAAEFSMRLEDPTRGISVSEIRLWNPAGTGSEDDGEKWSVELTLTQLVFLPKTRS